MILCPGLILRPVLILCGSGNTPNADFKMWVAADNRFDSGVDGVSGSDNIVNNNNMMEFG